MQKKPAMCWVYDEDEKLSALLSQVGSHTLKTTIRSSQIIKLCLINLTKPHVCYQKATVVLSRR
jgi:hypothetical protein